MKIFLLLAWMLAVISTKSTIGSTIGPIHAPLEIISLEDVTPEERKQIAYFEHKLGRPKRSGSGDILGALKNAIGAGIKRKVAQVARASASASGHFSRSSSSSGGHTYHHPEPAPESHDHKSLDFWSLKKSILNTLLQAVKAIKGGVIAVKGQLIKGSGKLISAKGKLISYKGEAITNLGKNIATSAILVPYHGHPSSGHGEYVDAHYSAPSAPEEIYHGAPSAPGPDYHVPEHYPPPHNEGAEGLLILKKIPSGHHHPHGEDVPPFKPLAPTGPSFGTIVGKFLSASTSLDPHQPEPFGNTASANDHYHESPHSESHYYHHDTHDNEVTPRLISHEEEQNIDFKKPVHPTTSYGTPFEEAPSYVNQNFDDHAASSSKSSPKFVKTSADSTKNNPSPTLNNIVAVDTNKQNLNVFQTLPYLNPDGSATSGMSNNPSYSEYSQGNTNLGSSGQSYFQKNIQGPTISTSNFHSSSQFSYEELDGMSLPNIADYPDGFPPSLDQSGSEEKNEYADKYFGQSSETSSEVFQKLVPIKNSVRPHSSPSRYLQSPKREISSSTHMRDSPTPNKQIYPYNPSKRYRTSDRPSSISSSKGLSHYRSRPKPHPHNIDFVKSVSYELGPNGPKRLT